LNWSAARTSSGGIGATPTPNDPSSSGKRPTKLTLFCNRTGPLLEIADCAASVADAGPQPVSLPTGTIVFEATAGFFPAAGSCNPTQTPYSPGIGSCKSTFQIPNGFPIGAKFPIEATYSGNTRFQSSSTSHKLIVASCVGTTENPCKNSIGLDFNEIPTVVKDAIDALVLCGGTAPGASSLVNSLRRADTGNKVQCVINSVAEFDLAAELIGLTPDQFRLIASKITTQQAGRSTALQNYRKIATTATDEQLTKLLDPNAPQGNRGGYVVQALRFGVLPRAVRRALAEPAKKRKEGNPTVSIGSTKTRLKAGAQKAIKFRLNRTAKDLVAIFRAAGYSSLPIKLTVEGTRSDSKKIKKVSTVTEVQIGE
jgi:hypothetical protein